MKSSTIALSLFLFAAPTLLPAQETKPATQPSSRPSVSVARTDGYPLGTCVVSGKPLGEKQKLVEVKGHSIKVCCGTCAKKVEADPDPYIKKLEAAIIAQQGADYPLDKCLISGKKLGPLGKGKNIVVDGQLVRLCCGGCIKKATTTLKDYVLGEISKASYAKQIAGHEHGKGLICPVSGKPADRKGTAQMIMHGNKLYAVCCKSCLKKFKADPHKYIAKMGAAKKASDEKGQEGDHGDHDEHEDHGEHKK